MSISISNPGGGGGGGGLVADAINDGVTTVAPSQNAVFDALALLVPKSLVDAKGDLIVGTADNTVFRLAVGANGTHPIADSTATSGIGWAGAYAMKAPKATASGVHTPETLVVGNNSPQGAATAQNAVWWPCFTHRAVNPLLRGACRTLESGSSLRVSLWTFNYTTLKPGTLIEDMGLMSGTTTGERVTSASTATVPPGWFYVGVWVSNHSTARWERTGGVNQAAAHLFGTTGISQPRSILGWYATGLDYSSAWNSTLPTLTAANDVDNGQLPVVWWEYT